MLHIIQSFSIIQVTFSEKGTKITTQTHIREFETLKISLWNQFHSAVFPLGWCGTLIWTENVLNNFDFTDIVREMKDFKFLDVSLESDFCSFLRKSHLYKKASIFYCSSDSKFTSLCCVLLFFFLELLFFL